VDNYSLDEITRLLRTARNQSHRDWLMLVVQYNHGLRAGEVCGPHGFTKGDVQEGQIINRRLKGSLTTVQALRTHDNPLFDERAALEEWVRRLPDRRDRAFPISTIQFWRRFDRYRKQAGIRRLLETRNVLKHSIACHSIEKAGIHNVKQFLGHVSMGSTGQYLRKKDAEAVAAVYGAL